MPDRPAQIASTVIRLGSTRRSGISRMRGPPRPCGSKGWNGAAPSGDPHQRRIAALPPNSASTVSPATAVWPTATRGNRMGGQEDVDARAEADQAETLADGDVAADIGPAEDAAGDEAGDLHRRDLCRWGCR
jgi:hypothetical protein